MGALSGYLMLASMISGLATITLALCAIFSAVTFDWDALGYFSTWLGVMLAVACITLLLSFATNPNDLTKGPYDAR